MVVFCNGWKKIDTVKFRNISHGDTALIHSSRSSSLFSTRQFVLCQGDNLFYFQSVTSTSSTFYHRCVLVRCLYLPSSDKTSVVYLLQHQTRCTLQSCNQVSPRTHLWSSRRHQQPFTPDDPSSSTDRAPLHQTRQSHLSEQSPADATRLCGADVRGIQRQLELTGAQPHLYKATQELDISG